MINIEVLFNSRIFEDFFLLFDLMNYEILGDGES